MEYSMTIDGEKLIISTEGNCPLDLKTVRRWFKARLTLSSIEKEIIDKFPKISFRNGFMVGEDWIIHS